ncbi:MAG TPA: vWA domain-containing protein [Polyangiaceae bacterium]|nr:vWA domain-containing protein [Polyangiaceae bacterium]
MRLFKQGSACAALLAALSGVGGTSGCSGGSGSEQAAPPWQGSTARGGARNASGGASPIMIPSSGGTAAGGASSSSPSTGGAPSIGLGGSSGSAAQGGEKACSAETREGRRTPLDMYFLVDSSGSMADDVEGGTKWELVSSALIDFLDSPRNSDLGAGIGYFPNDAPTDCSSPQSDCVCDPFFGLCFPAEGGSCEVADYETPAVPLAIPTRRGDVVTDLWSHDVVGSTPTRPALEGALKYLSTWAAQHADRKSVVVLATDGEPTECDANTPDDVADIAARALAANPAIQTFVIGVGDSLESLDVIARAGGTGHAYLVDPRANLSSAFAEALDKIRGAAGSCDFTIPSASSSGEKVNPSKVNVRLTVNGVPTRISQTFGNDPSTCGDQGGWYFDNPSAPTRIRLCESTCQALSGGTIDVEFGCDTVVQPPR